MIAHLRGKVSHRGADHVIVDVNGVGYLIHVTPGETIPPRGESVELHTSLQVREDSMTLYGFSERGSLTLFSLLLSSSGVGPKLALAALGTHRPEVLRTAIAGGDVATLTAIPGVGKKVAERLILELKDKVGAPDLTVGDGTSAAVGSGDAQVLGEVRDALLGLGYSASEAQEALASLGATDGDASDLLRHALRYLGTAAFDGAKR